MFDRPLDWDRDAADWPLREHSRFVEAAGLRWHVQRLGQGPPILLVHGTGASAHSWHAVAERLADSFELIAIDLPGHGFTTTPDREAFTLPGMARRLGVLLRNLGIAPRIVVGHSAGSAILCRMCLDREILPDRIVSVNGALLPFRAPLRGVYAAGARLLAATSLPSRLVARRVVDANTIDTMIRESGSQLPQREVEWYARLAGNPFHVRAALQMMAGWDLVALAEALPRLRVPVVLVQAEEDAFVRPRQAVRAAGMLPSAECVFLSGLGHLAHEERPESIEALIRDRARARA